MVKHKWGVIYKLTNKNNGKYYFGRTVDYKRRMNNHKNSWKKSKTYLSNAIKKYGWGNFTKEIIVANILCKYITTKANGRKVYDETELNRLEEQYISLFQSDNKKYGYNLTKGGEGISGLIHSDETKKKMTMSAKKHHAEKGSISLDKRNNKWQVRSARPTKYIGCYLTEEKATDALNLYNKTGKILPSDTSTRRKGTGSICFDKRNNKWQVKSARPQKYIGYYNTKEKALKALKLYNETRKKMESDISIRRNGTGSITFTKKNKKWLARSAHPQKHIGYYNTKEKALKALKLYNKTGKILPPDLSKRGNGTGCISFDKGKMKWRSISASPSKCIGCYKTKEKATEALQLFNETGRKMKSDLSRRKKGTGSIRLLKCNKYQLRYKGKHIGLFNTKELAEEALKKIINN